MKRATLSQTYYILRATHQLLSLDDNWFISLLDPCRCLYGKSPHPLDSCLAYAPVQKFCSSLELTFVPWHRPKVEWPPLKARIWAICSLNRVPLGRIWPRCLQTLQTGNTRGRWPIREKFEYLLTTIRIPRHTLYKARTDQRYTGRKCNSKWQRP